MVASSRHSRFVLVALVTFAVVAGVGTFFLSPTVASRSALPDKATGALPAEPLSSNEIVDRLDRLESLDSTPAIEPVGSPAVDGVGQPFGPPDSGAPVPPTPGSSEMPTPVPEPTPETMLSASEPA